jgi:hypothetical protein
MILPFDAEGRERLSRYRNTLHALLRSRCFGKLEREDFLSQFEAAARVGDWVEAQLIVRFAVAHYRGSVSDELPAEAQADGAVQRRQRS